jgi:xanthine dehydrogenase molybdenum-binding subunit
LLEESVGLPECLQSVSDWWAENGIDQPFVPQHEQIDGEEWITCWGLACGYKNTGLGTGADDTSGVILKLLPAGRLQIKSGSAEIGQGMVTTLQLIAAEVLGIDTENINVFVMDTDLTPNGGPTTASRQTYVTGNAVREAALLLRERLLDLLVQYLQVDPEKVLFNARGASAGEQFIPWQQLYEWLKDSPEGLEAGFRYHAPTTNPIEVGGRIHVAYGFAAQAVQIAIHPQTGEVRPLKVVAAHDVGRVINPLGFHGQVEGGIIMGIGHGLMEEFKVEEGRILSDRPARYDIPRMRHLPEIVSMLVESEAAEGPFGAKGGGELVCVPTAPALANAVFNAIGLRVDSLPITAEKIKPHLP